MWNHVLHAGYWIIPIIGMWLFLYCLNAVTWQIIIKGSGDCPISFLKLFKITISGFALNYATPVGLLGGEPYKILETSPYLGTERATSSVLLFAMMHIFAHFWYWLTAIFLYCLFFPFDMTMYIVIPLALVFCLGGIYLFTRGYKNGLAVKGIKLLSHIPGCKKWGIRMLETHGEQLSKIDSQIAGLHKQDRKSFYMSFLLEYLGRMCHSFEIFFMLMLTGIEGNPFQLFLYSIMILAFTSLFANLLFFIPLQIGGREGGFAMSVSHIVGAMLSSAEVVTIAIFISIICRVREIFWTIIGLILIKCGNKKLKA